GAMRRLHGRLPRQLGQKACTPGQRDGRQQHSEQCERLLERHQSPSSPEQRRAETRRRADPCPVETPRGKRVPNEDGFEVGMSIISNFVSNYNGLQLWDCMVIDGQRAAYRQGRAMVARRAQRPAAGAKTGGPRPPAVIALAPDRPSVGRRNLHLERIGGELRRLGLLGVTLRVALLRVPLRTERLTQRLAKRRLRLLRGL